MKESLEPTETGLEGSNLGVLLGSGLGSVSDGFETEAVVPFEAVPGLEATDVPGHDGEFRLCKVTGRSCLFIRGRKHHYEGTPREIVALVKFLHRIGIERLVLTSAAGSLTPAISPGEFVLADEILDLQFRRPQAGGEPQMGGESRAGGGYNTAGSHPSRNVAAGRLAAPYGGRLLDSDPDLCEALRAAAAAAGLALAVGTLASLAGPLYETPAEVQALQRTGASAVSMSGAPEMTLASSFGIRVATIVLITNWATGTSSSKLLHDDVVGAGGQKVAEFRRLIAKFVDIK